MINIIEQHKFPLIEKLDEVKSRSKNLHAGVKIVWRSPTDLDVFSLLKKASEEEQLELLSELKTVYFGEDECYRKEIFGEVPEELTRKSKGLMGTISGDGRQFRLWSGIPRLLGVYNVDGYMKDLVLSVDTYARKVTMKYAETLLPDMENAQMPNKAIVRMSVDNYINPLMCM